MFVSKLRLLRTAIFVVCCGTLWYFSRKTELLTKPWTLVSTTRTMTPNDLHNEKGHEPLNCTVRLAEPGTFPLVALLSSPGSGNTWVRNLLQQATGFYTGSVYHHGGLADNGFIGELEDVNLGTTLTMKTHLTHYRITPASPEINVTAAIIIIRNPFDMTLSEKNRETSKSQVGITSWYDDIRHNNSKLLVWKKYAVFNAQKYMGRPISWMQLGIPYIIVHYENIIKDTIGEVKRMTDFLNVSYAVTEERIKCLQKNTEGNYHRTSKDKKKMYEMFTEDLKKTFIGYMKGLSQYLPESQPIPWQSCFSPLLGNIPNISSIEPLYDPLLKFPPKVQT